MSGRIDREKPLSQVWRQQFGQRLSEVHRHTERVEIIPDDRPPTRKQEQLISKLTKDFPEAKELGEYSDYKDKPTKANASVFITRALEENWSQVQQSDGYMKYIATRPRAERLGDHGSLVMKMLWTWSKPCRNWISTTGMCGRIFSP